jgi:hypothetical protein
MRPPDGVARHHIEAPIVGAQTKARTDVDRRSVDVGVRQRDNLRSRRRARGRQHERHVEAARERRCRGMRDWRVCQQEYPCWRASGTGEPDDANAGLPRRDPSQNQQAFGQFLVRHHVWSDTCHWKRRLKSPNSHPGSPDLIFDTLQAFV